MAMWQWIIDHKDGLMETGKAIIEIAILWVLAYQTYRLFKATRAAKIMLGLILAFVVLMFLTLMFKLTVISTLLTNVLVPGLAVVLVVIFQPELRTGLAKLGSHPIFSRIVKIQRVDFLETLCKAVSQLSNKRFGALFAIEREISLKPIEDSGVRLDAIFSPELAMTIFFPKTALHDGGVIIASERLEAAGCVFPVTAKEMNDRTLGLRHRAAVGISDETDAIVIVVSEETGAIALAYAGKLERNIEPDKLKGRLEELLNKNNEQDKKTAD